MVRTRTGSVTSKVTAISRSASRPVFVPKLVIPTQDAMDAAAAVSRNPAADDSHWDDLINASVKSALVVFGAKLASAIGLATMLGVTISRQFAFGFIPYAGLSTSVAEFRRIATLSSVAATVVVIFWLLIHLARQRRYSLHHMWGIFLALPMVCFMVLLEWLRRVDVAHLVDTAWLVRIGFGLVATAVVFFGFLHREEEEAATRLAAQANPHQRRPARARIPTRRVRM